MIAPGFGGTRSAGRNVMLALMITTALSGCTSVELADSPEIEKPAVARVATTAQQPAVAPAVADAAQTAPALADQQAQIAAQQPGVQAQPATVGVAALPSPVPAQAAALQTTTLPAPGVAPVTAAAPAPVQTALASVPFSTEQPSVVPVRADPPWVKTGRVQATAAPQSSAELAAPDSVQYFPEMPLPQEVTEMRSVVPAPKPGGTLLAYAGRPQSDAFSAMGAGSLQPAMTGPLKDQPPADKGELQSMIDRYAALYEVPRDLVHRVVHRESRYNPAAYSKGNFGLMQIRHATARSLGFQGPASGLFDAETNLKYAVKYLKGAWMVADKDKDAAVRLYAKGYYYEAKRKGMLHLMR